MGSIMIFRASGAPHAVALCASGKRWEGIGASEAAAVLGLSQYRTPYDVWEQKVAQALTPPDEAMYWGLQLEGPILNRYVTNNNSGARTFTYSPGPIAIPGSFVYATPDLVYCEQSQEDRSVEKFVPVEAKNVSSHMRGSWGTPGSDHVPTEYLIQVQVQMHALNMNGLECPEARFAVLFGGNHYEEFRVPYNRDMAVKVVAYCDNFFKCHVIQKAPPPKGRPVEEIKAIVGKVSIATKELADVVERLRIAKSERDASEETIKALSFHVKDFMLDAEILATADGTTLATYKNVAGRTRFDKEAFVKAHPLINIDQWYVTDPATRRFEIKD